MENPFAHTLWRVNLSPSRSLRYPTIYYPHTLHKDQYISHMSSLERDQYIWTN